MYQNTQITIKMSYRFVKAVSKFNNIVIGLSKDGIIRNLTITDFFIMCFVILFLDVDTNWQQTKPINKLLI